MAVFHSLGISPSPAFATPKGRNDNEGASNIVSHSSDDSKSSDDYSWNMGERPRPCIPKQFQKGHPDAPSCTLTGAQRECAGKTPIYMATENRVLSDKGLSPNIAESILGIK
ncbi:MAG: hypothetical protein GXO89_06920 [Chlorobi bacterium]|nr:hypothetical protein [Chlorobiota bacterium]